MIKIIVSGITLPLPSETKITREVETTILNRELANSDFTYPFNIPLTDEVNVAFGFISEAANKTIQQTFDAELIIDDLHFQKVQVKVLKVSLKSKTVSISVLGNYTNIATLFGTKKVNELYLGGVRTIGDWGALPPIEKELSYNKWVRYFPSTSHNHIGQVVNGAITTDYVFGKAIDYGTAEVPLTENNGMSVINAWDRVNGRIIDATLFNIFASHRYPGGFAHLEGLQTPERHFWVPFFRLGFFIKKSFEESGWSITTDLFTDAQFMNIVHYNTYSINRASVNFETVSDRLYINVTCRAYRIWPQDHAPRMTIVEFLNEIGKNYNIQYYYDFASKKVTIRRLKNINSFAKNIDLTDVADPEPDISFADESDLKDGFNFEFASDISDMATGVDIDFDANLINRGSYTIPSALATISAPAENNVAFVTSENKYYKFDGSEWIFYAHNLFSYKTTASENVVNVKSKCITMPMTDEVTHLQKYYEVDFPRGRLLDVAGEICPYSQIGIEGRQLYTFDLEKTIYSSSVLLGNQKAYFIADYLHGKEYYPHVILWLGYQASRTDSSGAYPFNGFAKVATVPYTCTGAYVPGYAQPWILPLIGISTTKTGLIPDWWDLFITMLVNSNVTLTQKVLLDILKYADIDFEKDYIWINNLRYLCTKAQINLPFPEVATLKLIKV